MTSARLPDATQIVSAISEQLPCGEDMSFSQEFDAIQEARREDDPSLEQGEWVTSVKEADWPLAGRLCEELLAKRTKDLRLCSWLTESLARIHGPAGMARGLEIMQTLIENRWDDIHPLPDNGDQEQRIGNIAWLISRGVQLTKTFPVAQAQGRVHALADLELARTRQGERSDDASVHPDPLKLIREAQRTTPRSYHEQLLSGSHNCLVMLERLDRSVDARLGMDGPSFTPLRAALQAYAEEVERTARENGIGINKKDVSVTENPGAGAPQRQGCSVPAIATGSPETRAQALRQLRDIAEFFRRTEPHSPVAYLAEKAANWGEMPLDAWLRAVLKEDAALSRFEDLLGFGDAQRE